MPASSNTGARYSSTPSAFAKSPQAAQQYAAPPKPPRAPAEYQHEGGRKSSPVLSRLAFVLAVISLLFNAYLFFTVSSMKAEARSLIDDLQAMKNIQSTVTIPINQEIPLQKDIQVGSLFSSNLEIPLEFSLPVNGVVTGITPQGLPQSFTFTDQKIPIKTSVPANITVNGSGQGTTISINEQIPIDTSLTLNVSAGALYKAQLDSMISKLQKIAG